MKTALLLVLLLSALPAFSYFDGPLKIGSLNPIEQLTIEVDGFEVPISYNVTLPATYYTHPDKRYFVLFDLHPRSQPFISGMQDWLSHNGEWPWLETIIVTPANYHKEFADAFNAFASDVKQQTILDVLQNQMLVQVDKQYRTNGFRIYSGFMGNGALGLFILLNRPDMFNAYLISSPALARNFAGIMTNLEKKLQNLSQTDDIHSLYMTIGEHNYEKSHIEMFKRFKQVLASSAPNNLHWQAEVDNKHYYMSRPIVTLLNGIEMLFDDIHNNLPANSEISKQGKNAIIQHYNTLSNDKYGFEISAEGSLKNLAKSYLESSPEKALSLYNQVTVLYPDSTYAFTSLAKAYADSGDVVNAIKTQTIALEKSKLMSQWHQKKNQQYLEEYQLMAQKHAVKH